MADDTTTPQAPPPPRQITITTPSRRAFSADPPTTLGRRPVRTPGSTNRHNTPGLSASGRKNHNNAPPTATTPHGRAAIRAIDSRRAAIFTPGRRRSLRDVQRETPRDVLRALARNLAPKTERVRTSSSPQEGKEGGVKREVGSDPGGFMDDDSFDERDLRVPRMSLPLDDDDDGGDWPRPHRSAGLEDQDLTMESVEFGRRQRAVSEEVLLGRRRSSNYGMRMSDVYNRMDEMGNLRESAEFWDRGFPPLHEVDEDMAIRQGDDGTERLELEGIEFMADERRMTGRESDFGLVVPTGGDESTVFLETGVTEEEEAEDEEVTETVPQPEVEGEPMAEDEPFGLAEESHVHFADDTTGGQEEDEQQQFEDDTRLDEEVEEEAEQFTMEVESAAARRAAAAGKVKKKKETRKTSKHGIVYPQLPPAVVKRLAQTFAKTSGVKGKISPDAMAAIQQASEWFFESAGDCLGEYAKHAGRKTIDESDVLLLMRRQRVVNSSTTPFSLAQRFLPRELLQEMRMPPPAPVKKSRARRARAGDDDDGEEVT
ncbi:centromere kinetochore component CENP-T-domain-containing protein [Coniochaeta sp. 2T2.1]|nr:centromere kinetochore component CENP-T-domain-containing protein [Coniochaeta sp. 2T2.1]